MKSSVANYIRTMSLYHEFCKTVEYHIVEQ